MDTSEKGLHEPLTSSPREVTPQRPQTFFQRLSSGFNSLIPDAPLRKSTSKNKIQNRPKTMPDLTKPARSTRRRQSPLQNHPPSQIAIPKLSEPDPPCPYDPDRIHFYGNIDESRNSFCGLKSSFKTPSDSPNLNEPCIQCRSKSRLSHIASGLGISCRRSRVDEATPNSIANPIDSSFQVMEGPRLTPNAASTRLFGSLPKSASLPGSRVPSHNELRHPPPQMIQYQPGRHTREGSLRTTREGHDLRSMSPKIHHFPGLAEAKSHPYVHRRELEAHMSALRASSSSSLHDISDPSSLTNPTHSYPCTTSPDPSPSTTHPQTAIDLVQHRANLVIEETRNGAYPAFDLQLSQSDVYQRQSPVLRQAQFPHRAARENTLSTLAVPTPSTIDGKHLELKGGDGRCVRLRGGGGRKGKENKRGRGKCLDVCRGRDRDEGDEVPPPRALREGSRVSGRVGLPGGVARGGTYSGHGGFSVIEEKECTDHGACSGRGIMGEGGDDSNMTYTAPCLRGGAGSAAWMDADRLPQKLYWFAGGKGKACTVSCWKKQRGKKRMGGLLGMAVFGSLAGVAYDKRVAASREEEDCAKVQEQKSIKSNEPGTVGDNEDVPAKSNSPASRPGSARGVTPPVDVTDAPAAEDGEAPQAPAQEEEAVNEKT